MAQVPYPVGDIKLDKTVTVMRHYHENKYPQSFNPLHVSLQ
jgi:hypothetical protein